MRVTRWSHTYDSLAHISRVTSTVLSDPPSDSQRSSCLCRHPGVSILQNTDGTVKSECANIHHVTISMIMPDAGNLRQTPESVETVPGYKQPGYKRRIDDGVNWRNASTNISPNNNGTSPMIRLEFGVLPAGAWSWFASSLGWNRNASGPLRDPRLLSRSLGA